MLKNLLVGFLAVLWAGSGIVTAAYAQDNAWRIVERDGSVRVREPGEPAREARLNESVSLGTVVTTGAHSAATVENGAQRMVMSANSRMTISPRTNAGMTRILQDLGSILFQVDRQATQHFRVETPRLAAVVKGTTFTVTVSRERDLVSVTSGLVEVRANQGGAQRDVASGQAVAVSNAAPDELAFTGTSSSDRAGDGSASAPSGSDQLRGVSEERVSSSAAIGGVVNSLLPEATPIDAVHGDGTGSTSVASDFDLQGQLSVESLASRGGDRSLGKFVLFYLLVSFALGIAFFFIVRVMDWAGREASARRRG